MLWRVKSHRHWTVAHIFTKVTWPSWGSRPSQNSPVQSITRQTQPNQSTNETGSLFQVYHPLWTDRLRYTFDSSQSESRLLFLIWPSSDSPQLKKLTDDMLRTGTINTRQGTGMWWHLGNVVRSIVMRGRTWNHPSNCDNSMRRDNFSHRLLSARFSEWN